METIELTFVCPDLDSQASAMIIKEALANTPGVNDAEVSLPLRTVRVVLRDPDGESTVRRHLSAAGFPPED
jgi:copper chaperone CopZ